MEARASELRSTFPASFVLPLSRRTRSIEGWLELDAERVTFRNGAGLELGMRLDRLAGLSVSADPEDEPDADTPVAESDELAVAELADSDGPLQLMRIAGDCGPAPVCWEVLISSEDARTLSQELSAALGGRELLAERADPRPDVIALERDRGPDDDLLPPIDERRADRARASEPRRRSTRRNRTHAAADADDRAMLIRRRRIVALMVIIAALVVAIELAVTLFLIPG